MKVLRIFISSPHELRPERALVKAIIAELNNKAPFREACKLVAYAYEDGTPALVGSDAQKLVNDHLLPVERSDICICMLWKSLGTPTLGLIDPETSLPYRSGTEYEFLTAYRHHQEHGSPKILFYRCVRPIPPDDLDIEQFGRVKELFSRFHSGALRGLLGMFATPDELAARLKDDLSQLLESTLVTARQRHERERTMAIIGDHSAFLRSRLSTFVGRETELTELRHRIADSLKNGGYVTVTGQAGQGKSSIIAKLVDERRPDDIAHHFIPFNPGPDYQSSLMRDLMARFVVKYNLPDFYVASESRPLLREFFPRVLDQVVAKGGREVIFIDGLDQLPEDANGERDLSFLPNALPAGIVCVLGTRPNDTLRPLNLLRPHTEYQLPPMRRDDFNLILGRYGVQLSKNLADRFYTAMEANALYLDLVAKELAAATDVPPRRVFEQLSDNPESVFSLTIERLKRKRDTWERVVKPLLGFLLVACEPLRPRALRKLLAISGDELRDGLEKLGGLISLDGEGGCQLFHLKLREYLRHDERHPGKPHLFDVDEERVLHLRMAAWCTGGTSGHEAMWRDDSDPDEQTQRIYAREHYVSHLYGGGDWVALFGVLDSAGYGRAKIAHDPSTRSYARDLDLGCRAVRHSRKYSPEPLNALPMLWHYALLRCSLTSSARSFPDVLFTWLVLKRREREALELVELLPDPGRKAIALCRVGEALAHEPEGAKAGQSILDQAADVARMVDDKWEHVSVFQVLLDSLIAIGAFDAATKIAYEVGDSRSRVEALRYVAESLALHGLKDAFDELSSKYELLAQQVGYKLGPVDTFGRVREVLATPGRLSSAWGIVAEMARSRSRSYQLVLLFKAAVGTKQFEDARAIIECMDDQTDRASCLLAFAGDRVRVFNREHARATLVECIAAVKLVTDARERSSLSVACALLLARIGEREEAAKLLDSLARIGEASDLGETTRADAEAAQRVAAFTALATDVAMLGQLKAAKSILGSAAELARRAATPELQSQCLRKIAEGMVRIGSHAEAGKLYEESSGGPLAVSENVDTAIDVLRNEGNSFAILGLITSDQRLHCILDRKEWDEAAEKAWTVPLEERKQEREALTNEHQRWVGRSKDQDPWTAMTALHSLAQVERGLERFELQERFQLTKCVVRSMLVVDALLNANEMTRARRLLHRIAEEAEGLAREDLKIGLLPIIEAFARIDEPQQVRTLTRQLRERLDSLHSHERLEVLVRLVAACSHAGETTLAGSIARQIEDVVENPVDVGHLSALRAIAIAHFYTGKTQRLFELVHEQWTKASSREQILEFLPLGCSAIVGSPGAGAIYARSFDIVDELLAVS